MSHDHATPRDQRVIKLCGWKPLVSHHPPKFGCHRHYGSKEIMVLSLSRDPTRPCNQRVMELCGWKTLMVSHNSDKFGIYRHCCSGDKIVLVSQRVMRLCGWKALESHRPP